MRNKPSRFLPYCVFILTILACNLGASVPTPEGQGANILTLAAQTLAAQTPTNNAGISIDQALTFAVETLQAQATPRILLVNLTQQKSLKTRKHHNRVIRYNCSTDYIRYPSHTLPSDQ